MCIDGLLDTYITDHTIDGEEFCTFIERCLLPQLLPFSNGTNPTSAVIMDNASIHHVEPAVRLIEEHGVILHFLPPYSPDLDPIEEAFQSISHDPMTLFFKFVKILISRSNTSRNCNYYTKRLLRMDATQWIYKVDLMYTVTAHLHCQYSEFLRVKCFCSSTSSFVKIFSFSR